MTELEVWIGNERGDESGIWKSFNKSSIAQSILKVKDSAEDEGLAYVRTTSVRLVGKTDVPYFDGILDDFLLHT